MWDMPCRLILTLKSWIAPASKASSYKSHFPSHDAKLAPTVKRDTFFAAGHPAKLKPMTVQIYGTQKSQDSKKALRFFKERNVSVQFFDLKTHFMSLGELERFVQRFGLDILVDKNSRAYKQAGLEYLRVTEEQMLTRLLEDPSMMIQPLVRSAKALQVGWDEAFWKAWYKNL